MVERTAIPASWSGLREAMEQAEVQDARILAVKSLGLSLSDQYWICPKENPVQQKPQDGISA